MNSSARTLIIGLALIAIIAAAVLLSVISSPESWLALFLVASVSAAQLALIRRATGEALPIVALPIVAVNAVGVLGFLFYRDLAEKAAISAVLALTDDVYYAAASIFTISSLGLTVGALAGSHRVWPGHPNRRSHTALQPGVGKLAAEHSGLLIFAASMTAALAVLTVSPRGLISRATYSDVYGPHELSSLSGLALPVGLAAAALVSWLGQKGLQRTTARMLALLLFLLLFAKGSRELALAPAILLAPYFLQSGPRSQGAFKRLLIVACSIILSLVSLQLPLTLRSAPEAGLIPYTKILLDDPGLVFIPRPAATFGNILFAVPLAGTVAIREAPLTTHYLLTSLNPLPGAFTDWAEIDNAGINAVTPYSGLGELANYGYVVLFIYCALTGFILTRVQLAISSLKGGFGLASVAIGGGLTVLFSLNLLQYNLRSATREVWYVLFTFLAFRYIPLLLKIPNGRGPD